MAKAKRTALLTADQRRIARMLDEMERLVSATRKVKSIKYTPGQGPTTMFKVYQEVAAGKRKEHASQKA